MNPQVLRESVISMGEATKAFPLTVSRGTLHKWIVEGINGVHLEIAFMGARRVTSHEAIARFLKSLNETPQKFSEQMGNVMEGKR